MGDEGLHQATVRIRRAFSQCDWYYWQRACDWCGNKMGRFAIGGQWAYSEETVALIDGRAFIPLDNDAYELGFCRASCGKEYIAARAKKDGFSLESVDGYSRLVDFEKYGGGKTQTFASAWTDQDPPPSLDDILESNSRE